MAGSSGAAGSSRLPCLVQVNCSIEQVELHRESVVRHDRYDKASCFLVLGDVLGHPASGRAPDCLEQHLVRYDILSTSKLHCDIKCLTYKLSLAYIPPGWLCKLACRVPYREIPTMKNLGCFMASGEAMAGPIQKGVHPVC